MMIKLIGDSHTRALADALELNTSYQNELIIVPLGSANYLYSDFFHLTASGVKFTVPLFSENLFKGFGLSEISADPDTVWALSMGFHSARFFRAKMWKRFAPVGYANKHQQELSLGVIKQIILGELQYMIAFFFALEKAGVRYFVVSAPPPPDHHRRFRSQRMRRMAMIANNIYRSELANILIERSVPFLLPPDDTSDAEGLLLPHFNNRKVKDQHHANEDYGALMLPRILDFGRALMARKMIN